MADQQDPKNPEGTEGNGTEGGANTEGNAQGDPKPKNHEGNGGEGAGEGGNGGEGGKPGATVNRHKYERDLEAKDKEIEELKAQIAEAAKTKEGREELEKKMDDLKAQMASEKVGYQLELAGCVNVKAAKALLDDYDGDVAKLKEACPYLFGKEKQTGTTGMKPGGAPSGEAKTIKEALRQIGETK
ncbi:hypothetical protein [uncultured Senegalimassilia sp.]|uniref:hypothetical protein n=1 Tax=uncultured Senegalimassilia sp. TaxID=1714350 RepID=UPI00205A50AF|nr:hypothetical protein [uncultured Senegalimassilia sp.]DAG14715.1 MAG TPA: minor structural protein [Caudoviricetes sp.]